MIHLNQIYVIISYLFINYDYLLFLYYFDK
jgi:hypothetical protein